MANLPISPTRIVCLLPPSPRPVRLLIILRLLHLKLRRCCVKKKTRRCCGQENCFGKPTLAQFPAPPRNGKLKSGNVPKQSRVTHSSVHNLPHALILFYRRSVFQNLPGKYTIVSKRLNISINIKIKLDLPQLRFAVAFSVTPGLNSWPFCAALSSLFELTVPSFD